MKSGDIVVGFSFYSMHNALVFFAKHRCETISCLSLSEQRKPSVWLYALCVVILFFSMNALCSSKIVRLAELSILCLVGVKQSCESDITFNWMKKSERFQLLCLFLFRDCRFYIVSFHSLHLVDRRKNWFFALHVCSTFFSCISESKTIHLTLFRAAETPFSFRKIQTKKRWP